MDLGQLRQNLLLSAKLFETDAPLNVDFQDWGWVEIPQEFVPSRGRAGSGSLGPFAFAEALSRSRAYHSPHCATALAEHCGLQHLHDGVVDESSVEQLRTTVKQRINAAWSTEAVKQGVQHAKAGAYEEAHKCYAKAMELQPTYADAFVARGAAYANQGHFYAAISDFQHALSLDAQNTNADKYLKAVQQRAAMHAAEGAVQKSAQAPANAAGTTRKMGTAGSSAKDRLAVPAVKGPERTSAEVPQQQQVTHVVSAGHGWASACSPPVRRQASNNTSSDDDDLSSSQGSEEDASEKQQFAGQQPQSDVHRALQLVLEARRQAKAKRKENKHSKKGKHKKKKGKKHR